MELLVNIFILDWNPVINAQMHCDKHVRKMILESTQLLCTANWWHGYPSPYKPTHVNHPCSTWVRMNLLHWVYTRQIALALCAEYTYRWGKAHKCEAVVRNLPVPKINRTPFLKPPLIMPDECKKHSVPTSYKLYYLNYKQHILQWTKRERPTWAG